MLTVLKRPQSEFRGTGWLELGFYSETRRTFPPLRLPQ